jgi:hypothetical protein
MRHGDRSRASHDASVLAGALHWSAVRGWDPHPSTSCRAAGALPIRASSAGPSRTSVRAGDESRLNLLLANLRFAAAFWESDPGFNAWWEHEPNRVRNSERAYLDYLAVKGRA